MKFSRVSPEFDATDRAILELLQENCKQPLSVIGEKVGLKAPSVVERIHKLEEAGVITAYVAQLDARRLG
ncbi:MAG: Lrp/AsnC family transcriptional regulator, partial [Deltaproteobacteria bacterium]|nr:Lrp/AsnC family transcriptional regulator [Deltaproteobacteria bacterium]